MTTVLVALGSLACGAIGGVSLVVGAFVCIALASGGERDR